MLVLTRKQDDSLMIGDSIEVKVVKISGNRVRLAISAPREVVIRRSELAECSVRREAANHKTGRLAPACSL